GIQSPDDLVNTDVQLRMGAWRIRGLRDLVPGGLDRFRLPLLGNVDRGTDHPDRVSGRIVEDVATVHQGRIRPVPATEPILRGPHGSAAADKLVDAREYGLLVLRVQLQRSPSPG